ncbi:MAG: histidine phosphatase family protein [Pseudomonadales bacterium]|nr:histidine phosphatase family protein [Pseudomonadales bacterium]
MTRIHLFRHGESLWNLQGRMQGRKDSPLSEKGIQQARDASKRLADIRLGAVYCSPSSRTRTTAEYLLGKQKLEILEHEGLSEIDLGAWEGELRTDIVIEDTQTFSAFWHDPQNYQPRDGETFLQTQTRVVAAIAEIIANHPGQDVLVVSHAVAIKSLMCHHTGRSLADVWKAPFADNLAYSQLEAVGEAVQVKIFCNQLWTGEDSQTA